MRPSTPSARIALALALVVGIGIAGCDPPSDKKDPNTANSPLNDKTQVRMEVSAYQGPEVAPPTPSTPPPAATPSTPPPPPVSTTGAAAPSDADDPNVGGPQDKTTEPSVAPARPRIRVCYKKAIDVDPNVSGSATFDANVSKDGKVTSAHLVKNDGLTEDFVGCLLTAVKSMTFRGGQKTRIVPFTFGRPGGASGSGGADAGAKP